MIVKKYLIIIFFLFQLFAIAYAVFHETKYFAWVPYDEISLYEIEVIINDQILSKVDTQKRYRRNQKGRENRSIHHLINIIKTYELTYGVHDNAIVTLRFTQNRNKTGIWKWPENTLVYVAEDSK